MTGWQEVLRAWEAIAYNYDPVEADDEAMRVLRNPEEHAEDILGALKHIECIDESSNGLVMRLDYGFCLAPNLWYRGSDAVLQARALQQITSWCELRPDHSHLLQQIVVRHTFAAKFSFATPLLRMSKGFKFLIIPMAYQELLSLPAKALVEFCTGSQDGDIWAWLLSEDALPPMRPAPQAARRLVGRLLTSAAFHPLDTGENPLEQLQRQAEWFERASQLPTDPNSFEIALTYSGQDFAISHEIGHCLVTTTGRSDAEIEKAADHAGFRLYATSWGWRDEILDDVPLSPVARLLLGPLWFFFTAKMLFTLRSSLATRLRLLVDGDPCELESGVDAAQIALLQARWTSLRATLSEYFYVVKTEVISISAKDTFVLERLSILFDHFNERLDDWITEIPVFSLRVAVTIAKPKAHFLS